MMKRWLESGSNSSELFKMFIFMSLLVGSIYFGRIYIPKAYKAWQDYTPSRVSERGPQYRDNLKIIEAAKKERVNALSEKCRTESLGREEMIECFAKIKVD